MKYVSPYQYAKLCGVANSAIYNRIAKGLLEVVKIESPTGVVNQYIDIDKFPPERLRKEKSSKK